MLHIFNRRKFASFMFITQINYEKTPPIDDEETSSSLHGTRLCDQTPRIYNQDIPRWQHEMLGRLNPENQEQRNGGKSYFLSILIQHKHQARVTLVSYQIISTQDLDISLQGWATSEKAGPISIFLVCITSSKHWTGLLMAVNFIKFSLVN